MQVDKHAVIESLSLSLRAELADATRRALDAAAAATHEENRPEGSKDMRATEASYVARGQSLRVLELERSLSALESLDVRAFEPGDAIAASALVTLMSGERRSLHMIVPAAGGAAVEVAGVRVSATTPTSPLGAALLGLTVDEEAEVESPQGLRVWRVVGVE